MGRVQGLSADPPGRRPRSCVRLMVFMFGRLENVLAVQYPPCLWFRIVVEWLTSSPGTPNPKNCSARQAPGPFKASQNPYGARPEPPQIPDPRPQIINALAIAAPAKPGPPSAQAQAPRPYGLISSTNEIVPYYTVPYHILKFTMHLRWPSTPTPRQLPAS